MVDFFYHVTFYPFLSTGLCALWHATLRCEECGPLGYFCLECFDNAHRAVNRFHVAEKWEVCMAQSPITLVTTDDVSL